MKERGPEKDATALEPWQPDDRPRRGVFIPPSTPRHPTEPVALVEVPAGAEGPGSPAHSHTVEQYVNGWCLKVLILHHPLAGAPPLTENAHLFQLAGGGTGGGALYPPSQRQADRVAAEVLAANQILAQCGGLAFRICEIVVVDTGKVKWGPPDNPRRLSSLMKADGQINLPAEGSSQDNDPEHDFMAALAEIITNGGPEDFVQMMRQPCMHLLLVHDVETSDDLREEGVGSPFPYGSGYLSVAVVDAGTVRPGQTIAHEIAHALNETTHSAKPGNLLQEQIGPGDMSLDAGQCERMNAFAREHLVPACP